MVDTYGELARESSGLGSHEQMSKHSVATGLVWLPGSRRDVFFELCCLFTIYSFI
jgi:hypothetical protein